MAASDQWRYLHFDEIPYGDLDQDTLVKLASPEDVWISTSALTELALRKSPAAATLAQNILSRGLGDVYSHQQAIRILYELDLQAFLSYARSHLETQNLLLLEAMIDSIDFDTAAENPELKRVAQELALRAHSIALERFDWHEGVESFIRHFLA